ncbi:SMP-30/gluconolactonase/LRE family protein (plasmid) [Deinococcus sp. KNUC1210]|uniref:SMP-30/gluconolactonase/LRE family protein n=1 Tax=Deinococcus sp. KNUC1210 TaxID=2917691 RepID=UPI001EF100BB|nr:SMP-30/gluconolactonase/LRE family protein [Deinococcus sp. KNUC1210]ULH14225.1 SMP-30/gluconolactonase/LRE family protein [Deinococcus sp. KNUC1210]
MTLEDMDSNKSGGTGNGPETRIEVADERLRPLLKEGAVLECLWTGATWGEGPVYLPNGRLVWSDIPGNRLLVWQEGQGVQEYLKPSHFQNGHVLDQQGRIVGCSHGERGIVRQEHDGSWQLLVGEYGGNRLNSPNDVVVTRDGAVWFTDPPYGLIQPHEGYGGTQEQPGQEVYRYDPATQELRVVVSGMVCPNGLAFSPDESVLYVGDTAGTHSSRGYWPEAHHHILAYDMQDGQAVNARLFAEVSPGFPDGFRADVQGNIWTSSASGVQIYAADGSRLGEITVPEVIGNLTFGGPDGCTLYIAASTSLYRIEVGVRGATA